MYEKIEFFMELYFHKKVSSTGDLIFVETDSANPSTTTISFSQVRGYNIRNVFNIKNSLPFYFSSYVLFGDLSTHYKSIKL